MALDCEYLAVADVGVLLRFADTISAEAERLVQATNAAISRAGIPGITETIPSFTALYVGYDAMQTDFETVCAALAALPVDTAPADEPAETWDVPICYDDAPDLEELVERLQIDREDIIQLHLAGDYIVSMYGFAPGYAYMRGVPEALQLPRKPQPVPDVPPGSVIIAGPQCLVTTIKMPAGWWRIGETQFQFLRRNDIEQFPVAVGSRIRFHRIGRDELDALNSENRR